MQPFFAVVPRGLEAALAAELERLGAADARPTSGGVAFDADVSTACAINLRSRLATRILMRIDAARYRDDDDLYKLAARTPWESLIRVDCTLRVDVTAMRASVRSLNFATLRVKDGIVDRLRKVTGERPSIDTRTPQSRVFMFLDERQATLYLDLSGEPLFKRGWRAGADDKGAAPLKENLAAGLLALVGWQPDMPLYDPFCGSGTIAIEAAQMREGIAPGLQRSFGFERLAGHDQALTQRVRTQAGQARVSPGSGGPIAASDVDASSVRQAQANAAKAGLSHAAVAFSTVDFAQAEPPFPGPGMIVCNPPYGERIEAHDAHGAAVDMSRFGRVLKERFGGWTACLLSADRDLPARLGLKERRKIPLFNGPIECRLFVFDVFSASPRPRRPD